MIIKKAVNFLSRPAESRLAAISVLLSAMLGACEAQPPTRHAGIPATAIWAGGKDGGSWIDCKTDAAKNANYCAVYHEYTGEVVARGLYVLRDTKKAASSADLIYDGFDGRFIFLVNGKILEPVSCQVSHP